MNHTPIIYPAVLFALAVLALAGCKEEPRPPQAAPPSAQQSAEKAELEKRVELEREVRTRLESRLERQEAARNWWQSAALLMGAGSVITLVFGAVLGSRARHESET